MLGVLKYLILVTDFVFGVKQELWQVWRAFCLYGCFQRYIDLKKNIFDEYENSSKNISF